MIGDWNGWKKEEKMEFDFEGFSERYLSAPVWSGTLDLAITSEDRQKKDKHFTLSTARKLTMRDMVLTPFMLTFVLTWQTRSHTHTHRTVFLLCQQKMQKIA